MSQTNERTIERTAYPHIVKIIGACGGEPIIEGTRVAVRHIVGYHYRAGMAVEEIVRDLPHLTPSQVHAALAYYHDHQAEIDHLLLLNSYEYWMKHHGERVSKPAEAVPE